MWGILCPSVHLSSLYLDTLHLTLPRLPLDPARRLSLTFLSPTSSERHQPPRPPPRVTTVIYQLYCSLLIYPSEYLGHFYYLSIFSFLCCINIRNLTTTQLFPPCQGTDLLIFYSIPVFFNITFSLFSDTPEAPTTTANISQVILPFNYFYNILFLGYLHSYLSVVC